MIVGDRLVSFRCDDCGDISDMTPRQARTVRAADCGYKCRRCRTTRPASRFITASEHKYWTDRFGVAGAIELAAAIWGPIRRTSPTPAEAQIEYLAASANSDLHSVA